MARGGYRIYQGLRHAPCERACRLIAEKLGRRDRTPGSGVRRHHRGWNGDHSLKRLLMRFVFYLHLLFGTTTKARSTFLDRLSLCFLLLPIEFYRLDAFDLLSKIRRVLFALVD